MRNVLFFYDVLKHVCNVMNLLFIVCLHNASFNIILLHFHCSCESKSKLKCYSRRPQGGVVSFLFNLRYPVSVQLVVVQTLQVSECL